MQETFVAFLTTPTLDTFGAIRNLVVKAANYDGYSEDLRKMEDAYQQKRFADVKTAFAEAQPNLLLSPAAHLLLSMTLREEGNEKASEMERFICFRCVDGIKLTGDGTQEKPFLVLRTSDEYDMLSTLDKQFASQHLIHADGRSFDKISCADGSEFWFDITEMMAAMADRLNSGGK
jgi:hypothetical protein